MKLVEVKIKPWTITLKCGCKWKCYAVTLKKKNLTLFSTHPWSIWNNHFSCIQRIRHIHGIRVPHTPWSLVAGSIVSLLVSSILMSLTLCCEGAKVQPRGNESDNKGLMSQREFWQSTSSQGGDILNWNLHIT